MLRRLQKTVEAKHRKTEGLIRDVLKDKMDHIHKEARDIEALFASKATHALQLKSAWSAIEAQLGEEELKDEPVNPKLVPRF